MSGYKPRLPAVPAALTRPGGHPDFGSPLGPCPLIMEGVGRKQQCLEGLSITLVDRNTIIADVRVFSCKQARSQTIS